ncbi:hypothetical protein [Pectobacterium carotovorum]|uniref:hypothetical protein n=1 Tax=Pectobacterium carotovorum TaxID=554 RepID=UPI001CF5DF22|nr:hypothetical protein [Pectobacterium carotovorum]MCA6975820.1 hypothetical protein [Pectobacterium carotovorum]
MKKMLSRRSLIGSLATLSGVFFFNTRSSNANTKKNLDYPVNPLALGWMGGVDKSDDLILQKIINEHFCIKFPPGDFIIGDLLIPPLATISGCGFSSRIKKRDGAEYIMIFKNGSSMMYSKLRDLAFIGGGGVAIKNESYRTDISDVYFTGYNICFLNASDVGEWKIRNTTIENCYFGIFSKEGGVNSEINITACNCKSAIYIDNTLAKSNAEGILLYRCLVYKSGVEGDRSLPAIFIKNADYARLQNVMSDKNFGTALHIEDSKYVDEYGGYYASNFAKLKTPSVFIGGDCSYSRLRGRAEYSPYYNVDISSEKNPSMLELNELRTRKGALGQFSK